MIATSMTRYFHFRILRLSQVSNDLTLVICRFDLISISFAFAMSRVELICGINLIPYNEFATFYDKIGVRLTNGKICSRIDVLSVRRNL